MKTKNFLPALSLILIATAVAAIFAPAAISPTPLGQARQDIAYVINVNHGDHLTGFNCTYYLFISDERGKMVAPPQVFRNGIWTYTFKELGPVTGTRTAQMVRDPNIACLGSYSFAPATMSGTFKGGASYLFNLTPVSGSTTSSD
jgi:hypothetical protein